MVVRICKRTKIDGDTYPSSVGRTRKTNVTKTRCPSGLWAIGFEVNILGNWRTVDPDKGLCGDNNWNCGALTEIRTASLGTQTFTKYAPNSWFKWNSGTKACAKLWNFSFAYVYAEQYSDLPAHYRTPNDKKFKTVLYNCEVTSF